MTTTPNEFFPGSQRVIYRHSPLFSVICQWRFPTILRIESAPPADFQDAVRARFPVLQRTKPAGLDQVPPEIMNLLKGAVPLPSGYQFVSEDGWEAITLEAGGLSVAASRYDRWENFEPLLRLAFDALANVYKPTYLTRVGLRYQNALVREDIGLDDVPWAELLSSHVAAEFRYESNEDWRITEAQRLLRLLDESTSEGCLLQHGLGETDGRKPAYVIDIDCYADKRVDVADALTYLRRFNRRARDAFRWCISQRLHDALGPAPLGDDVAAA